jgi:cholesterol transport system auxiliary component
LPSLTSDEDSQPRCKARAASVLAALTLAAMVAGCGSAALTSYDLDPAPPAAVHARAMRGVLAIAEPEADDALDSERIVVRAAPNQLAYLTGAQWSERLPTLVHSRLITSFENARFLKSVGRPGDVSDYTLAAAIRRFEIDATADVARVEIAVKIIAGRNGRAVAARVFTGSAPAPHTADGAAAAALDAALADVMRSIVVWAAAAG